MIRPDGTSSAKVIQVIETKSKRGLGTKEDPVRDVTQYWDLNGTFLAEIDVQHCMVTVEYDAEVVNKSILRES